MSLIVVAFVLFIAVVVAVCAWWEYHKGWRGRRANVHLLGSFALAGAGGWLIAAVPFTWLPVVWIGTLVVLMGWNRLVLGVWRRPARPTGRLRELFGYDPEPYGEDGQDSGMSGGPNAPYLY